MLNEKIWLVVCSFSSERFSFCLRSGLSASQDISHQSRLLFLCRRTVMLEQEGDIHKLLAHSWKLEIVQNVSLCRAKQTYALDYQMERCESSLQRAHLC